MNNTQHQALNMVGTVVNAFDKYSTIVPLVPAFAAKATLITQLFQQAKEFATARGKDITGVAQDKMGHRLAAATYADKIGDLLQAWALDKNNKEMYTSMTFSAAELLNIDAQSALAKMRETHQNATQHLAALKDYGLTEAYLTTFAQHITDFETYVNKPRTAIGEKKYAGEALDDVLSEIKKLLLVTDKMISMYEDSSPEFVSAYHTARIIVNLGGGGGTPPPPADPEG